MPFTLVMTQQEIDKLRSRQEIEQEYSRCCTLLGDKQFKIKLLQQEVLLLQEKQSQLNQEKFAPDVKPEELPTMDENASQAV